MPKHRIHTSEVQAGNQGSSYSAWRAFCTCGWVGQRTIDEERYKRECAAHLKEHNA